MVTRNMKPNFSVKGLPELNNPIEWHVQNKTKVGLIYLNYIAKLRNISTGLHNSNSLSVDKDVYESFNDLVKRHYPKVSLRHN